MVDVKVGQTIRIYASVWNFCGQYSNSIYVHDVEINSMPSTYPPSCLDISGIGLMFSLVTTSASSQCTNCAPDTTYSNMGTGTTDVNGVAYIDYTVTQNDYTSWQNAQGAGGSVRVLACITNPKGQPVLGSACSDIVTVFPTVNISPTYAIEFQVYENVAGILTFLSGHTPIITSVVNTLMPPGSGWVVDHTVVDVPNTRIILYMSDVGSWAIADIAAAMMGLFVVVVAAVYFGAITLTVGVVALLVAGIILLGYKVYDLLNMNNILTHQVQNFETKDQNGTKLDQMVGQVENAYQNSPKTSTDCENRLNGQKLAYDAYFDTMAKDFPALFTTGTKNNFDTSANKAISDFKAGTITCDVAAGQIQSGGAIGKSEVSTNFTNIYTDNNPYVKPLPNPADCWIPGPTVDKCLLSAYTGWWLVGAGAVLVAVWGAYYFATRHPKTIRSIYRGARTVHRAAKKEVSTAGTALYQIAGPVKT